MGDRRGVRGPWGRSDSLGRQEVLKMTVAAAPHAAVHFKGLKQQTSRDV